MAQGEIWWADLGLPEGSEPGLTRPILVVQGDRINQSRIGTVVCVPITSNLIWAEAPGNVRLSAEQTGLPKDSVANVSQIVAIDRRCLSERVGRLSARTTILVLKGIDLILGGSSVHRVGADQ